MIVILYVAERCTLYENCIFLCVIFFDDFGLP